MDLHWIWKLKDEDIGELKKYTMDYIIANQIPIFSFRKCIYCKRAYPVELMDGFTCFHCIYRKHVSKATVIEFDLKALKAIKNELESASL
jgi:hypothetical protein